MSRDWYIGFIALAGIGALLFFSKTLVLPVEPPPVAEFGGVSLTIDYATTTTTRERGLGGRISIPRNYGMLFVFPKDNFYGFWMKDMFVPLDIFWLDSKGQVVSIEENVPPSSYPNVFYPSEPARYVLETAAGFAQAHGVSLGTPLQLKTFPSVSK